MFIGPSPEPYSLRRKLGPAPASRHRNPPRGITLGASLPLITPATLRNHLSQRYRHHAHPALRSTVHRFRTTPRENQSQLVTIVIPIYNVEEYLADCLNSVIRQTYRNLEIIIVDDGSPDNSYKISVGYARWDRRIRIIRRPNGGLGAARNTGTAAARGNYICFADSDDTLPKEAISRMVRSLRKSGSNFVVGSMRAVSQDHSWCPAWMAKLHKTNRQQIRAADFPEILSDNTAWNKLFEAQFFRNTVAPFPEAIRYEDQEPTAKAYIHGRFDVISDSVYNYRRRDDGSSISQQKSNPKDLRDRLTVKHRLSKIFESAPQIVYESWLASAVGFDMRGYFDEIPRTDEAFFHELRDGLLPLADRMSPIIWQQVPLVYRLPALAVIDNSPEDIEELIVRRQAYGGLVPGYVSEGHAYLQRRYLTRLDMEPHDEQLLLGDADLDPVARITSLWWHDTQLHIQGHAYIPNLPSDRSSCTPSARLVADNRLPVEIPLERCNSPRVDMEANNAWITHTDSGFSLSFDPINLRIDREATWSLQITLNLGSLHRDIHHQHGDMRGIVATDAVASAHGTTRWIAEMDADGLALRAAPQPGLPVTAVHPTAHGVAITTKAPPGRSLSVYSESRERSVEVPGSIDGSGATTYHIVLPDLSAKDDLKAAYTWSIRLQDGETQPHPTYLGSRDNLESDYPQHSRIRPVMTRSGTLRLAQNRWWAQADKVSSDSEALQITGRIDAPETAPIQARLVGDTQILPASQAERDGAEHFRLRIPFNTAGHLRPVLQHGFSARLSVYLDGQWEERWLAVSTALQHQLPADQLAERYGLTLTRTRRAGALWVRFRIPQPRIERGRYAQRQLHQHFRCRESEGGGLRRGLDQAVLFESFNGRSVTDSVLSICHELKRRDLGLDLYWTVNDLSRPVPEGATPLLIHSQHWMDVLHNAKYLVNNNNFPFYFRKRAGQVYIQTWHGTPLKKVGDDVPPASLSLLYRDLMKREPSFWDYLLAQNEFAAETLASAFNYQGEVLTVGYPRNDTLFHPSSESRRSYVRRQLGLGPNQFVVLYAPTWRDNLVGKNGYALANYLDIDTVQSALGNDSRVLLRGHSNTAKSPAKNKAGMINVTTYPEINDLILASDVLITDYSSVMFDYANTEKPIFFLAPDLDNYAKITRGFYFDLSEVAPGPVCKSNADLYEALRTLKTTARRYAAAYDNFSDRFTYLDDGQAAARLVDTIWGVAPPETSSAGEDDCSDPLRQSESKTYTHNV